MGGRGDDDLLDLALFDTPKKSFIWPIRERLELPSPEGEGDKFGSLRFFDDFLFGLLMLDIRSVVKWEVESTSLG